MDYKNLAEQLEATTDAAELKDIVSKNFVAIVAALYAMPTDTAPKVNVDTKTAVELWNAVNILELAEHQLSAVLAEISHTVADGQLAAAEYNVRDVKQLIQDLLNSTDTTPRKIVQGNKVLVNGHRATVTLLCHDAAGFECAIVETSWGRCEVHRIDTLALTD